MKKGREIPLSWRKEHKAENVKRGYYYETIRIYQQEAA